MKLHMWNGINYRNYLQFEPIEKNSFGRRNNGF